MVQERVGRRVRVYWTEEEEWFDGIVREYEEYQGYYVVYDDGDERWEPKRQPMLFEGEEEARTTANYDELRVERDRDQAPEMMEPPVSPGSNYDDNEQRESPKTTEASILEARVADVPELTPQLEAFNESDVDTTYQHEEKEVDQHDTIPSESKYDREENTSQGEAGDVSDGEQSDADSDMPQTFTKIATETRDTHQLSATRTLLPVPVKGFLQGRILRATGLQTSRSQAPNAFVRVSFVEAGDTTNSSAMLRCKETLTTTSIVQDADNPVWREEFSSRDTVRSSRSHEARGDGEFQLELLPRIVSPTTKRAGHELPGDVLFTVFSVSGADGNGVKEHIGQAMLSLRRLLQDLLTIPFTTRALELRSRSGKRLGDGNVSTRSLLDDERAEAPSLVVSLRFIPTYETKPKIVRSVSSVPSASTSAQTSSCRRQEKAPSAKRTIPARTSSSCINRRRFEKQVAKENRSFARQLEWKEARRTRLSAQAKAQETKQLTPAQHGARKHGHKAHSGINRTRFVQQVAEENKGIGKRLQNILGSDDPDKVRRWTAAEPKDSTNFDYMNRDKVHAQEKRWQRQVELDFVMEKAQTTYQQQHALVDEVTELQEAVARLQIQVNTLHKSVLRCDILNKKDQHVRDCLLRAAVTLGSSTAKTLPAQRKTLKQSSSKTQHQRKKNDHEDGAKTRKEQEWELLTQHRSRLQAEKQKLSQELKALNQQEVELDKETSDQQFKWEHAMTTQLFHRQMDKKNAIQAQKAAHEMKRRQKALELSREEEEHWACYQAHQQLRQLQIAIQILRDESDEDPRRLAATRASSSSSAAVCEYLTKQIDKQKSKLQQLQAEVERRREEYQAILVSGGNESLRKRVQELQKLVFLCKSQAAHVRKADRSAQRQGEQVDMEFQRHLFREQTETEIVLKRPQKQ